MAKARYINEKETYIAIFCKGCDEEHHVPVTDGHWQFNGSLDKPTLSPSLLIRSGHFAENHKNGEQCWCTFRDDEGKPSGFTCVRCHSFIREGMMQYLSDCSHELAGQTIELPDF